MKDPEEDGLRRKIGQAEIDLKDRMLANLGWRPQFRLLLLVGYDEDEQVRVTLASLRAQAYAEWRIFVVPGRRGLARERLREQLVDGSETVGTLRARRHENGGAAAARRLLAGSEDIADRVEILPPGLTAPLAEFCDRAGGPVLFGLLAAGDVLSADALLEVALASGLHRDADFFYSDELRISPVSGVLEPFLKPQWSPDLLLATNYIGRLWCATADLIARTGMTLADVGQHGEYDLVLRATEAAGAVRHIPELLCRRGAERLDGEAAERQALERALARRGIAGTVAAGAVAGTYRVRRRLASRGRVSIIIPMRAARGLIRTCLDTLRSRTAYRNFEIICIDNIPADQTEWKHWLRANADTVIEIAEPFNWSRFNNRAAARAGGEFLLFLNDDVEIIEPDWLEALLAHGQRPEVGVVGARLLYPDGTVQHAGMFWVAGAEEGRHAFRHADRSDPGYFGLAVTARNVIAVTGACMLMRRDRFTAIGGFDERHTIVNNDVDLCLRCRREGGLIVYEPAATLIHHERASHHDLPDLYDRSGFRQKWGMFLKTGDPYYHPKLARERDDYRLDEEPAVLIHAGHPLFRRDAIRRILMMKLDHIGDFATAVPAIRRLQRHFPQAALYLVAPPANHELAAIFAPEIAEIIPFEFFFARSGLGLRELSEEDLDGLQRRLAPYRFDLAIDLRKDPDTRHLLRLTGARWLVGYDRDNQFPWLDIALEWEGNTHRAGKRSHVGDDLCRLVDAVALAAEEDRTALRLADTPEPHEIGRDGRPLICVHPGVGTETRQWPAEHFAALIDLLAHHHDVDIALIGGADETAIAEEILAKVTHKHAVRSLIGKTRLSELPALLRSATLYVGNNSGPKHIAAGLGVPTIGIHSGVVDAREWGPLGPNAVAVQRRMRCSPCYLSSRDQCPRGLDCLTGLPPATVYEICKKMLWAKPPPCPEKDRDNI